MRKENSFAFRKTSASERSENCQLSKQLRGSLRGGWEQGRQQKQLCFSATSFLAGGRQSCLHCEARRPLTISTRFLLTLSPCLDSVRSGALLGLTLSFF